MDEADKQAFLEWLLKPRKGGTPFVTYRGARIEAEAFFQIPLEEIRQFFGVDTLDLRGKIYKKKTEGRSPNGK